MTLEEHTFELGKLQVNFHSLELLLRLFLAESKAEQFKIPSIGQVDIEETHLTNYDSLGQLITKYNNLVTSDFSVDYSITRVRDALAHGRVISSIQQPPLRLFKFNRPQGKQVNLVFDEILNKEWFDANRSHLFTQIEKIRECARIRGLKSIQ